MRSTSVLVLLSLVAITASSPRAAQDGAAPVAVERFALLGTCPDDGAAALLMAAITRHAAGTDNAPEEKERGITINTSHVEYRVVPCHARGDFLADVVTGASRPDTAVALVTPRGGVAGARDQIFLAATVGIPRLVVFANDVALSEADTRELTAAAKQAGFPGDKSPIIRGSALGALTGRDGADAGIAALVAVTHGTAAPRPDLDGPFLMPIDDVVSTPGRGTVATGRIESGVVWAGDGVELGGMGDTRLDSTITGIEMFRKILDRGEAGDNVGLLLRGIDKKDIRRGMVIARPGTIRTATSFRGRFYLLKKEEGGRHTPFHNKAALTAMAWTAEVGAGLQVEAKGDVNPGDTVNVRVSLIVPIAMDKGLRFAIREGGRTVGAGQVTEIIK